MSGVLNDVQNPHLIPCIGNRDVTNQQRKFRYIKGALRSAEELLSIKLIRNVKGCSQSEIFAPVPSLHIDLLEVVL
jgi:hypothetical protein